MRERRGKAPSQSDFLKAKLGKDELKMAWAAECSPNLSWGREWGWETAAVAREDRPVSLCLCDLGQWGVASTIMGFWTLEERVRLSQL